MIFHRHPKAEHTLLELRQSTKRLLLLCESRMFATEGVGMAIVIVSLVLLACGVVQILRLMAEA